MKPRKYPTSNRSRVTNKKRLFLGADSRSKEGRRIRDLIAKYTEAAGGEDRLNTGEEDTIRRLAALIVLAETQEGFMVACSPKYNPDIHLRATGQITRLVDDLDFPKRRPGSRSAPDIEDVTILPDDDMTFEEYLSMPSTIASAKKGIPVSDICGKVPGEDGKGPHVFKTRTRLDKEKANGT